MKKIYLYCITFLAILVFTWGFSQDVFSASNEKLDNYHTGEFISITSEWEKGIVNTLFRFARDLKNLFFLIATVFYLVIVLRLILASNTEEELWKFKKGIIWITVWLIIMQIAYVLTITLFDGARWVDDLWQISSLWTDRAFILFQNLILPIITLLQTLASFFFLAIAIYAFYRLVTSNGNDEAASNGKKTIWYALIWFLIVILARQIIEAFYGRVSCDLLWGNCGFTQDISSGVQIIISIINWLNWFVAIVVVIMILYTWARILLSAWDEDTLKKSKSSLVYIAIWLFILFANFLILTIFLRPESLI